MSDTPLVTIEKDFAWVRAHILVALLAIVVIAGTIFGGVSLIEYLNMKHDERVAAAQLAKEGVDTAIQAALMAQFQQEHTDNLARDAAQTTLIKSLISQMAQQHVQTDQQIKTDGTLDAKDAAARLVIQTKASSSEVVVNGNTVSMDLPLTRIVVSNLDLLPQAQSDVTNLQGQLSAQKILTSDSKVELADATKIITADKVELIATIKADNSACDVRVDKQAAKDRKRGFWASVVSFAGGLIVRGLL